jgi:uncharacterized membrane protein YccC
VKAPQALIGNGVRWLLGQGSEARQTVRVMIGTALAFAIYRGFNLPQGYWAVFTVVIVMQTSIGATLSASIDRTKGTALGAMVGAAAALLHPHTPVGLGAAMTVAVGLTAFAAALRPSLKVAPVTAVIMLIIPAGSHLAPLTSAGYRVLEIIIGGVIGVGATLFIFPARSIEVVSAKTDDVLNAMADVLDGYAEDLSGAASAPGHESVQMRIRTLLAAIEAALADADRERSSRLAEYTHTEALPRTLWRVRGDIISVNRALGPLPESVSALVEPTTRALIVCEAAFMRRCGAALLAKTTVDRKGREEALQTFEMAIGELRRSRLTHDLDFDAVGHLFGRGFALESLHRNLTDLADRIDEAAASLRL